MKKILSIAITACLMASMFTSCIIEKRNECLNENLTHANSLTFKVNEFDVLDVDGACKVMYTQGAADTVRVEGEPRDVAQFEWSQEGNKLTMDMKNKIAVINLYNPSSQVTVYISSTTLTDVELCGASDLYMDEPVKFDKLRLKSDGASTIGLTDFTAESLRITASGASNMKIKKANVGTFDLNMSGAGDINANVIGAENVDARLAGAAAMDMNLTECGDVNVEVSGAGSVTLSGDARSISKSKSGAASIDIDDLKITK